MPWNLRSPKLPAALLRACVFLLACATAVAQIADSGNPHETVLHSFGGPDGDGSLFGVIADAKGDLYGTTVFGGPANAGTVFKLTPLGSGYRESVLHRFRGGSDGATPFGGLVADKLGALYGATLAGGNNGCGVGCGVVFKLAPRGSGYRESVLYSFHTGTDANQPVGALVLDKQGAIYGVTQFGGSANWGAVFKLTPGKSGYTESVLYSFPGGAGGYLPSAGLTIDNKGSLYGTTSYGGTGNCDGAGPGTIFRLTPGRSGYTESILYSFKDCTDGVQPFAALTVDENTGAIYGTTQYGGNKGAGTVFKLTPSGSVYDESILHSFDFGGSCYPDGFAPESQLLLLPDGTLYGTDSSGGGGCSCSGCGSIFRLKPSRSSYAFQYVYNFGDPLNGAEPEFGNLISDAKGALYGTTRSGGSRTNCADGGPGGALGCGVVFKLLP
jgi:uncharacterized repeat protein (TIGR03803 family)